MFKKLLSTTLLSITLTTSIYAEPSDINTENLVMDDMGTFLVKKLNLSTEEAKQSADKLYEKGHSIFSQKGKVQKVKLSDWTAIEFPESSNQRKAMKYLIAAGMLRHPKAAFNPIPFGTGYWDLLVCAKIPLWNKNLKLKHLFTIEP